jgi:hypothetical protein
MPARVCPPAPAGPGRGALLPAAATADLGIEYCTAFRGSTGGGSSSESSPAPPCSTTGACCRCPDPEPLPPPPPPRSQSSMPSASRRSSRPAPGPAGPCVDGWRAGSGGAACRDWAGCTSWAGAEAGPDEALSSCSDEAVVRLVAARAL